MKAQMFNYSTWIDNVNSIELKKVFENKLNNADFVILGFTEHFFEPYGYTALFLLAESHLAIHTFPEENKTYVELSSCVKNKFDNFIKSV